MEPFITILLHECGAAALVAFGCRLVLKCQRQPRSYLAVMGALVLASAEILYFYGGYLLYPGPYPKVHPGDLLVIFLVAFGLAVIPGFLVVRLYRQRVQVNTRPKV